MLVEVAGSERLRVARAEHEDVADLDRGFDGQRLAAAHEHAVLLVDLGVFARDLEVGRVGVPERDLVLAGGAWRHVLMRAEAAHHADV